MAESPAHRFGQIVGDVLEAAFLPLLQRFAKKHDLYLDRKGSRACRKGSRCRWVDLHGNAHDLDFVLERGGTPQQVGTPVAFIEIAWRRYTKHSRNKAQEIQGAIEPLAVTYGNARPFKGAILAGVFTEGAQTQLRSLGFKLLYLPYPTVMAAFAKHGIDAAFDETTPDSEFARKVRGYEKLTPAARAELAATLAKTNVGETRRFMAALETVVARKIERVYVLVLHGSQHEIATIAEAVAFIKSYRDEARAKPIERVEVRLLYTNGEQITGAFNDQASAIEFLRGFQPL